ncbi:MAG: imidazole glycerol phosphate synthase subunit HisF [Acidobacteria bacterium]|nr:MAG: imidazole glycerol phosphate synthase subunit HisF [Acidobacteriota bacterium]REK03007.1 MAG: imidazole glycerol phosphate synthase subunit HisF [Acidobacteriota bacterium]REK13189.1 MAG: imidazole glycerol phosphate synthase subunit HisF [Acidobacteriota bacterium]REK41183.1 MAG: imidazole glycerol phosphate synthase subunit HisF [Acidobacteriota bacterium]
MLAKRIIPCLDVKDGRTVKGTKFKDLRDAGDAVELAARYSGEGADEIIFLDITATNERRKTAAQLARSVAEVVNIPFTIGGGVNSVEDARMLLDAGADKISINTAAVRDPDLLSKCADRFGSQAVVLAIDAKLSSGGWEVFLNGGREGTGIDALEWAVEGCRKGAGELLLTSMDADGTKAGFDCELTYAVSGSVPVPVIASGGAGEAGHFAEVFRKGKADAALAASMFHFNEILIADLKSYLKNQKIPVRL